MSKLGFVIDYAGRLVTFSFVLYAFGAIFLDWERGLGSFALAAACWLASRAGRYVLAGHADDPVLGLPLSWW